MHFAVKHNNIDLIEFLLFKNINGNIQSIRTGNTALHVAAERENIFVLTMLIHHGADTRVVNKKGELAMSLAVDSKIKLMFKPQNIQKIRNQRTLKKLLTTPIILDFDDDNDARTESEEEAQTDLIRQHSISESLPNGTEMERKMDEWYIERFTEIEQGIWSMRINCLNNLNVLQIALSSMSAMRNMLRR